MGGYLLFFKNQKLNLNHYYELQLPKFRQKL